MGVLGLWRLLDATGKPVPLETLEGKVLAIDISIWIHQVIQGYQDRRGNMLPNAHLIGLFNRICKLIYFKIKPVFVFDGGVPLLKKNTIATRRKLKSIAASKAQKLKNDLINNLIKHTAVKGALDKGNDEGESSATQQIKDSVTIAGSSRIEDMYKLPEIPSSQLDSDDYINSDDEPELSPRKQTKWMGNIHTVDVNNEEFKSLPADVRYDILTDLKETRKQNSWGKVHEFPKGSHNYSGFQMTRLLKRRHVQQSLEEAEKEMGGKTLTLEELDRLLTDQGIDTTQKQDAAFRIASDSTTRVIYVKDKSASQANNSNVNKSDFNSNSNDALLDSTSIHSESSVAVIDDINAYDLEEDWNSDEDFTETTLNESSLLPKSDIPKSAMNPALAYMLEHSGFSRDQVLKLVEQSKKNKAKSDAGSSQGSLRRGKKSLGRTSLKNRKKKKLFDTAITIHSPKIKEEVVSDVENEKNPETSNTVESSSDTDDFIEVPEFSSDASVINKKDQIIINESEDSGSDDFIEIPDVPISEPIQIEKMEIPSYDTSVANKKDLDQIIINESEDSGSDDFIEIPDVPISEPVQIEKMEIPSYDASVANKKDLDQITINESEDSGSDDFIEIPDVPISEPIKIEKRKIPSFDASVINKKDLDQIIINESEDSGSDDFIEIPDVPIPEPIKIEKRNIPSFEISIKANENLKDDIFADIFADIHSVKKEETRINNEFINKINDVFKNKVSKVSEKKDEIELKVANISFEEIKNIKQSQSLLFSPENSYLENEITSPPTTPQKQVKIISSIFKAPDEYIINEVTENNIEKELAEEIVSESENETPVKNDLSKDDITITSEIAEDIENSQDLIIDDMFKDDYEESIVEKEPTILLPVNEEELESMKKQLESEREQIAGSLGKLERQAIDITDQMRLEAQELLRLFGVPYIVAPMEAEAQCAYLEQIKLTDGTITDDSDIWLFGGSCVYKNFFDNNKKVLQFLSKDIEHHFKLTRNEMIQLALLVGSDYTNGLAGVGPVTALEILASFPSQGEDILRGLRSFSTWYRAGKLTAPTKSTLRNKLKNVQIEKGFPSQAVVQAYLCPTIDESKEPFSWSKPNLVLLSDYAKKKFGWTKLKFDEIITPVMKKMEESKSQKGIEAYFKVYTVPKSIEAALSKRVQTAVQKLHGKQSDELSDEEASTSTATKSKAKRPRKMPESKSVKRRTKKTRVESGDLPSIEETNEEGKATNEAKNEAANKEAFEEDGKTIQEGCETINKRDDKVVDEMEIEDMKVGIKPHKFVAASEEVIPQRERDKINALKSKLKAIEIFRKSKKGLGRVKKAQKVTKKVKKQAELSEDSSSS